MFTKLNVPSSLVDAVKSVTEKENIEEGLKGNQHKIDVAEPKGKITGADFKALRSGKKTNEEIENVEEGLGDTFKKVAKAAHKALTGGSDEDQLKRLQKNMGLPQTGKKPVQKEETESVEEGWDDMLADVKKRNGPQPSGGSGVKQGTRYGGGKQKDKPEQDDDKVKKEEVEQIDELKKSTVKSYIKKKHDEMYKTDAPPSMSTVKKTMKNLQRAHDRNTGVKPTSEEVEQLVETMTRKHFQQVVDVIKAHPDQAKRNELAKHHAEIFKASNPRFDHARFYKAAGAEMVKEDIQQVDERELSSGETKEKERIVKGMKKSLAGFKARYGDRAKSVMYATATKQAKKD